MRALAAAVTGLALAVAAPASAGAVVMPAVPLVNSGPAPSTPSYVGSPATPDPFPTGWKAPQNPGMAENPLSNVHNDTWMTDDYTQYRGPLGRHPRVFSTAIQRDCITLDLRSPGTADRLLHRPPERPRASTCSTPTRLDVLAFKQLPYVPPPAGHQPGAEHHRRRLLLPRQPRPGRVRDLRSPHLRGRRDHRGRSAGLQGPSAPMTRRRACSPTSGCPPCCPTTAAGSGSSGARRARSACSIPRPGAAARSCWARRSRTPSRCLATAPTSSATRRSTSCAPDADLKPHIVWRAATRTPGLMKTGQINAGSGTTPTLMFPRRRHHRDPATSRSPTTPTRSTWSSTGPPITPGAPASSARSRCSRRARAPTRTR